MERKQIVCTVRSPVFAGVSNGSSDFHSGCAVMEVLLPKLGSIDIEEISFKNYYTAILTLLARFRSTSATKEAASMQSDWHTCIRSKTLMPFPHCEDASEDYFSIKSCDCLVALTGVAELRFVLQQPSPMWKEFKIEEIQVTRATVATAEKPELVQWLSELDNDKHAIGDQQLKGVSSVAEISKRLQHLWALTENAQLDKTNTKGINRYDVDGCYDVSLLSHN